MASGALQLHRAEQEQIEHENRDDDYYGLFDEQKAKDALLSSRVLKCLRDCFNWQKKSRVSPEASALMSGGEPQLPSDYFINPEYWPRTPWVLKSYLWLAQLCHHVVHNSSYFNNGVTLAICIAGINVGIQTYPDMDTDPFVDFLDMLILVVFTLEMAFKIIMEGFAPIRYLTGPEWKWNIFDATIIILSYPIPVFLQIFGGNSIALLRLIRLARLGKLIKRIPALRMIIQGLVAGMSSIKYVIVLLVLVFYLYGVLGFYLFSANDPFHFGSLPMAMLTMFRVSCLDNWGDIMFQNIFGCDYYPDVYVMPPSPSPPTNDTTNAGGGAASSNGTGTSVDPMFYCNNPQANLSTGVIFFVSFVVISALIMLSLFIGAVTVAMVDSMDDLKKMNAEKKAKAAKKINEKRARRVASKHKEEKQRKEGGQLEGGQLSMKETPGDGDGEDDDDEDPHDTPEKVNALMGKYPWLAPFYLYKLYFLHQADLEAISVKEEMAVSLKIAVGSVGKLSRDMEQANAHALDRRNPLEVSYVKASKVVRLLIQTSWFRNLMTLVILASSILVGAQTDYRLMRYEENVKFMDALDLLILLIFTGELVLKFIALEFLPLRFFRDSFNNFDLLVVVGSWIPGAGGTVIMLRLLRLLRVLKLIKSLPQLAVMINAIYNGLQSIAYIGLVMLLFFYVASIIALLLFQKSDPWNFGSLHKAFITLFRGVTLDSWTANCYTLMFGCDVYQGVYHQFPDQCTHPVAHGILAPAFYVVLILIGTQVLLSLFIGVISTSMDDSRDAQIAEQELELRLEATAKKLMLTPERIEAFRSVFALLDLDCGGTIDFEELKIGLESIDAQLSDEDIIKILLRIDPEGMGLDINGFINFMVETPMFSTGAQLVKLLKAFGQFGGGVGGLKKNKRKVKWWKRYQQAFSDLLAGGSAARVHAEEMEAALMIQDVWTDRRTARKVQAETKLKLEAMQREKIQARLEIQRGLQQEKEDDRKKES